jgi:hypothetical protein
VCYVVRGCPDRARGGSCSILLEVDETICDAKWSEVQVSFGWQHGSLLGGYGSGGDRSDPHGFEIRQLIKFSSRCNGAGLA